MLRLIEHLGGGALLDDLAVAHHDHFVAQRAHHAQIMADEHVGQAVPCLQIA